VSITLRAKRILTGALAGALVLGLLPAGVASANTDVCEGAASNQFTDSNPTHQANINCIAAYDIVNGFADGTFGGSRSITRAQMATFIANFAAVALNVNISAIPIASHSFTDVAGNVHANNIARIYGLDITQGRTATTFAPNDTITRAEAATMLYNAHIALGVSFAGVTPSTAFTDLGGSVHTANINLLAGAGVINGKTATTFAPTMSVSRAETATLLVNSTVVLVAQGKWNAPALIPVVVTNIVTSVTGSPATAFSYSNGTTITAVTIGMNDVFVMDGTATTKAVFAAAISVGDEIVVQKDTPSKDRQTLTLTNRASTFYTSGVISGVNTGTSAFNIIEPVSGATLRAVTAYNAALTTYVVDGAAATLAQFNSSINDGDRISIGGTASERIYTLTNQTVSGTIASVAGSVVTDAKFTIKTAAGATLPATGAFGTFMVGDSVTVNGVVAGATADAKNKAFHDAAKVGYAVTYSKVAGVQTVTLTAQAIALKSGTVGPALNGLDGGKVQWVTSAGTIATSALDATAANYNFTVGGSSVSEAVFKSQLRLGDSVSVQEADGTVVVKGTIALTKASAITGEVRKTNVNTAPEFTLRLHPTVSVYSDAINGTGAPFTGSLILDPARYQVNGGTITTTVTAFNSALNSIKDGSYTGAMTITNNGTSTLYSVTLTGTAIATFLIDTSVANTVGQNIDLTFTKPVRRSAALVSGDYVVTVNGLARNVTNVTPVSPDGHSVTLKLTIDGAPIVAGNELTVTVTAQGAAKLLDVEGNAVQAGTKAGTVA
jgi:hypothetical protein